jgi:hypothetical protein
MLYVTNYRSSAIALEQDIRGAVGLVVTVKTGLKKLSVCLSLCLSVCLSVCRVQFRLAPIIYSTIFGSKIKIYFSRNPVQIKRSLV